MRQRLTSEALVALVAGVLFGAGLALGGMTDPARVRGFLDLFGNWDPTLAFVMGGAVLVMAMAWLIQPRMIRPLFTDVFNLPKARDITPRLVIGAGLFGVGWGLAGLCPGPGIAALVIEPLSAAVFVATMLVGMVLVRLFEKDA
ncbi:YeeE/YedE family protein [Aurantiacibacter xanthus]|uniref:YeeE/YedE family protein n=1 Tax=Aurantiacibacter xanthus TaxID=1784712 RepID=A0A3A1P7A7_9SPHN|nr:YeeE/YedE family protein [Aurantiacibacter xanthus]RIV89537.1 YeeE/YedE family protein [Aurantiacibacter xanthus]